MPPIGPIQNAAIEKLTQLSPSTSSAKGQDSGFAQQLMDVIKEVNQSQQKATEMGNDFMAGRQNVDYHDLMISMARASTTMNLTVAVRNKLLDAYQEIDKMQV
jgi:flagellar hook-basal body complex protein FliE